MTCVKNLIYLPAHIPAASTAAPLIRSAMAANIRPIDNANLENIVLDPMN